MVGVRPGPAHSEIAPVEPPAREGRGKRERCNMVRWVFILAMLALCSGASAETRVLVLGDSILAWNKSRGQSIPQLLNTVPGLSVESRAVSGAAFSGSKLLRREIRSQLPRGRWDVIVVNGGGNDLAGECGCRACAATLNQLVSANGTDGEIPAFLDRLAARASRVIWLDYYPVSVRGGPFAPCIEELAVLEQRMQAAARLRPHVAFVDAGAVYDRRDLTLYTRDLVHPTPKGGARIATLLARAIGP